MSEKQAAALVAWTVLWVSTATSAAAETSESRNSLLSNSEWVMGLSETGDTFWDDPWAIGSNWDGTETFGNWDNSADKRGPRPEAFRPATERDKQPYLAGVHSPATLLLQIEHMPGPALLLFLSVSAALAITGPVSNKRHHSE